MVSLSSFLISGVSGYTDCVCVVAGPVDAMSTIAPNAKPLDSSTVRNGGV
jgi:hypothetical protein